MNLLRLIPGWAWAGLLAALLAGLGWLQIERVTAQRDVALSELKSTQGEVAALQSALEYRRAAAERLQQAIEQREKALAKAHDEIREHREALNVLEDDDAEVRDWLPGAVPGAIDDWLRNLRAEDGAGAGDAKRAAAPDRAAPSPRGESGQSSRPTGPAR